MGVLKVFKNKLRLKSSQFITECDGNFAIMGTLALVPIMLATGAAVDFNQRTNVNGALQAAADAAALAGMRDNTLTEREIKNVANLAFSNNLSGDVSFENVNVDVSLTSKGTILVSAKSSLPTTFMSMVGINSLQASAVSEASSGSAGSGRGLEIVLALDETQSMGDLEWELAVDEIDSILDSLSEEAGSDNFYVTLLPFNDRVNVGKHRTSFLGPDAPADWTGCVEPREENNGAFPFYQNDDTATAKPFAISIPEVTGGLASRGGGYPHCARVPIIGPTKLVSDISSANFSYGRRGTGRFEEAMAWAWRLLSPQWRGQWGPADYPSTAAEGRRKVVVFLSDGRSSAYTYEMDQQNDLGNGVPSSLAFDHLVETCREIKENNIEIYMYQFKGAPVVTSYFKQCATSEAHYVFINDDQDLKAAFKGLDETETLTAARLIK